MGNTITERTLFFKNLEYFKINLGLPENLFYNAKGVRGVIPVTKNSYESYRGGTIPGSGKLKDIADALNDAIAQDAALSARFPTPLLPSDLKDRDLSAESNLADFDMQTSQYEDFVGAFMCYYNANDEFGNKITQYGVVQFTPLDKKISYRAHGVFFIKNQDEALRIYNAIAGGKALSNALVEAKHQTLFTGEAYLTSELFRFTMNSATLQDFIYASFGLLELPPLTAYNNVFFLSKGLTISSITEQDAKSEAAPLILAKKPLELSMNELINQLHFNYHEVKGDTVNGIAQDISNLVYSVFDSKLLSQETLTQLIAIALREKIVAHLSKNVYNTHCFLPQEQANLYDVAFSRNGKNGADPK